MATREYCANLAEELGVWSQKLHDLSGKIDRIPSINKYKIQPQIEELHMIMTELDDRLCELTLACPTVEGLSSGGATTRATKSHDNRKELFDYDFGG